MRRICRVICRKIVRYFKDVFEEAAELERQRMRLYIDFT